MCCLVLWLVVADTVLATSTDDAAASHPMIDAFVAAGLGTTPLWLSDLKLMSECGQTSAESPKVDELIPGIVDKALARAQTDHGRILEYVDEDMQIGDNQGMSVRGATITCFVASSLADSTFGPASYAAHVAAYALRGYRELPADPRLGPNMSLLVEADVMEMPVKGALFTPRHYCFDFASDDIQAVEPSFDGFISTFAKAVRKIPVRYGRGLQSVTARSNRLVPTPSQSRSRRRPSHMFMRDAFRDPKAELLHLIEKAHNSTCSHECSTDMCNCLFQDLNCSRDDLLEAFLAFDERPCTATGQSFSQFLWLQQVIEHHMHANEHLDLVNADMLSWPFVLSPSIAASGKTYLHNSFSVGQWNPFSGQNESKAPDTFDAAHSCICNSSNLDCDDTVLVDRASAFAGAVQRRLHEHTGTPTTPWWRSPYIWPLAFQANRKYFEEQETLWESGTGMHMAVLAAGNLTQKQVGRTADWLMVTEFDNPGPLKELMVAQYDSAHEVYDRAAEQADAESPCSDAG